MKTSVSSISLLSVWFALACGGSNGCPNNPAPPDGQPAAPTTEAAPTSAAPASAAVPAAPSPSAAPPVALERIYVGSGDWGTATGAVTLYNYDATTGSVTQASRVEAGGLLSFLATDSKHQFLYAADEEQKKLRSFAINPADGSLTAVSTTDMLAGPVYVNLPHNDAFVLAAEFIVIGERPQRHAARVRAARNFGRRELAVGNGGMTVEVGVHRCLEKDLHSFYCNAVSGRRAISRNRRPEAVPMRGVPKEAPFVIRRPFEDATRRTLRSARPLAPAGRGGPCALLRR